MADLELLGTLVVIIIKARNLPNRRTLSKQSPYCVARVANEAKHTDIDEGGGQTPKWDHEMRFKIMQTLTKDGAAANSSTALSVTDYNNMKLSVFDQESSSKVNLIGDAEIGLIPAYSKSHKEGFDSWHNLKYKGKFAGEIFIEMTFYRSRPTIPKKSLLPLDIQSEDLEKLEELEKQEKLEKLEKLKKLNKNSNLHHNNDKTSSELSSNILPLTAANLAKLTLYNTSNDNNNISAASAIFTAHSTVSNSEFNQNYLPPLIPPIQKPLPASAILLTSQSNDPPLPSHTIEQPLPPIPPTHTVKVNHSPKTNVPPTLINHNNNNVNINNNMPDIDYNTSKNNPNWKAQYPPSFEAVSIPSLPLDAPPEVIFSSNKQNEHLPTENISDRHYAHNIEKSVPNVRSNQMSQNMHSLPRIPTILKARYNGPSKNFKKIEPSLDYEDYSYSNTNNNQSLLEKTDVVNPTPSIKSNPSLPTPPRHGLPIHTSQSVDNVDYNENKNKFYNNNNDFKDSFISQKLLSEQRSKLNTPPQSRALPLPPNPTSEDTILYSIPTTTATATSNIPSSLNRSSPAPSSRSEASLSSSVNNKKKPQGTRPLSPNKQQSSTPISYASNIVDYNGVFKNRNGHAHDSNYLNSDTSRIPTPTLAKPGVSNTNHPKYAIPRKPVGGVQSNINGINDTSDSQRHSNSVGSDINNELPYNPESFNLIGLKGRRKSEGDEQGSTIENNSYRYDNKQERQRKKQASDERLVESSYAPEPSQFFRNRIKSPNDIIDAKSSNYRGGGKWENNNILNSKGENVYVRPRIPPKIPMGMTELEYFESEIHYQNDNIRIEY